MILMILLQLFVIMFCCFVNVPDEDMVVTGSGAEVGMSNAQTSESTVIFLQISQVLELDQVW